MRISQVNSYMAPWNKFCRLLRVSRNLCASAPLYEFTLLARWPLPLAHAKLISSSSIGAPGP
jgi:hypothetical protein